MKVRMWCALIALFPLSALAANSGFLETYAKVSKDMVPELQQTQCEAKAVKNAPGRTTQACQLKASRSVLLVDSVEQKTVGVWLRLNAYDLSNPSDLPRAGGMLLRAVRGGGYGDYLKVSMDVFLASLKIGGKKVCQPDAASGAEMCVSNDDKGVYDITIDRK